MATTPRRFGGPIASAAPPRTTAQPLLTAGLSAVVLVALSGAFLIGLAIVGLLAAAVSSGCAVVRGGAAEAMGPPKRRGVVAMIEAS